MIKVGFIGAGGVNFGSPEGPWNHSSRLERIPNVKIVGIADPDTAKATQILNQKLQGDYAHIYEGALIRASFQDLINLDKPDAVFIGLPPHCHGLSEPPFNVECICADAGIHMFIEKPVSSYEPTQLEETARKIKEAQKKGVLTSVGYMFRYSKSVDKMKEIIREESQKRGLMTGNNVTTIIARYNCAYSLINKKSWWDVRNSGGPIVEQCTHFVDLVRYISDSECDESSLFALGVHASQPNIGKLTDQPAGEGTEKIEDDIPEEYRVNRATTALWRFNSGALCQIAHGVQLQGSKYESEIEVWADGVRMTLENPYSVCRLQVRRGGDQIEVFEFDESDLSSDPYFNEVKCFIDAISSGDSSLIRSSYADALETYKLTWAIQNASVKSRK